MSEHEMKVDNDSNVKFAKAMLKKYKVKINEKCVKTFEKFKNT